jgi:hypothetical protein
VADWETVAGLATGCGTLVLAVATFGSVRSANRSARVAERSLMAGIRPLLVPTRFDDPFEKVNFQDQVRFRVDGGRAVAEVRDGVVYLAISLRNVGPGIAVLDRYGVSPEVERGAADHLPVERFRRLTRDLYIPAGGTGFWQGAFRDRSEPEWALVAEAIAARHEMTVDLLYGDYEGGQHTISRFAIMPIDDGGWYTSVSRHWNLDRDDPR